MRMITRVEEVVVQCSVKPVVEELDWASMKKNHHYRSIGPPKGKILSLRNERVTDVEEKPIEEDLVIPVHLDFHYINHIIN